MNANDLLKAVMELDLEPIKTKLMHVRSGEGWSAEKTSAVEKEYRRFLCLMKLYPHEDTAPLVDVDTFWHYHILDTMKYAADCQQVFGYFLHHYPYVGMRGANDEAFRVDSGERMRRLYEATFGDAYPAGAFHDETEAATAFCAGPDVKLLEGRAGSISANTAFCAGPDQQLLSANTAFCAGPDKGLMSAHTAFCAGPDRQLLSANTAFCAGPDRQLLSTNTAFCAGPDGKIFAERSDRFAAPTAYDATEIVKPGATQAANADSAVIAA